MCRLTAWQWFSNFLLKPFVAWTRTSRDGTTSGSADTNIRTTIEMRRNVPPFYRNLARVIMQTNMRPFRRGKNRDVIHAGDVYTAGALDQQGIPDGTRFTDDIECDIGEPVSPL